MTGILIIARLGSNRLPHKHLIEANGKSFIEHLVNRIGFALAKELSEQKCKIVIATSDEDINRKFEEIKFDYPVSVYYGNLSNIPLRQAECAVDLGFDKIVSVDGDDILISATALESIFQDLNSGEHLVKTVGLPLGMNVIGYSSLYLQASLASVQDDSVLETGWGRIFDPNKMKVINLGEYQNDERLRFTLDYPEDAVFFKEIIEKNSLDPNKVSDADIINCVIDKEIYKINAFLNNTYMANFNNQVDQEKKTNLHGGDMASYKKRLHHVIPGGAHTYSRGDDQYPSNAPSILERGEGAYVYSPDGEKYLDYGMGLRSVNIGYANKEIADACFEEMLKGNNLTRASLTELKAAELITSLIPSVEMVKFAKHGSTVTSAAIKLARAYTGKKYVAVPIEQPFFSFDDWFIGSTVLKRGVPEEISKLTLKFNFNDIKSLKKLFDEYKGEIACVILEPATHILPEGNFLQDVKALCEKENSVFILDEMITGFRWHMLGAQTFYNVEPDLCTFGKAMANGFALAALCGKRKIMEIAGILDEGAERVFLTSTTHGAEMSGLGAFIKTMEILQRDNVIEHFWSYGTKLINGIQGITDELGISEYFLIQGAPCSPHFVTKDADGNLSLPMRTLFLQEMINNGVIMPFIAISFAHKEEELKLTLKAIKASLSIYKKALSEGLDNYLHSPVIKPVFRKFN